MAESELARLVSTPNESDFAAEVANLVPRQSELHERRAHLHAEELDWANWNGLDLAGVNSEPEVVQSFDQQLSVLSVLAAG